jgi:alkaline phosphatase D
LNRKVAVIIFTVSFGLLILISNISMVLLLHHPTAYAAQQDSNNSLFITHGIASGDVTNQSVIIWSRANREAQLHVEYDTDSNFPHPKSTNIALANQTTDYTAHAKLEGLSPDTVYYYRVWFSSNNSSSSSDSKNASVVSDNKTGSFRTAINPSASSNKDIKFIFAADLGGQMHCRQIDTGGYSIFSKMQELSPDFFIANGDMIYAVDKCPSDGPDGWRNIQGNFSGIADPDINWTNTSQVRDVYLKHWQYNRGDSYLQRFLQNTSMYSQWDDHEVINDFGASWQYWNSFNTDREGYPNIVKAGREAFFNYSPIDRNPEDPNRIYRSFNWGPDLDLLILDARSYRSPNSMADKPENNKTMLGSEQLQWLKQKLLTSSATWKVLSSDVPISVPTGSNASILGRDGWASGNETTTTTTKNSFPKTGFENELQGLLEYLDYNNIKNIVFVTTDVHFPANIRYEIDANGDGDKLIFHELISGPLSAIRIGMPGGIPIPKLDTTFNPRLLYEEGGIFNFGYVKIQRTPEDNKVHLIAEVRSEDGLARPNSLLDLAPQ